MSTLTHQHHATEELLSFLEESSAFGRDAVIELIVNEYISTSARSMHEHHTSLWLHKALEAVEFSETDGEPAQVTGYDFLFVGSVGKSTYYYDSYQNERSCFESSHMHNSCHLMQVHLGTKNPLNKME